MKKLQSVSLFATAGVLALTTAVYMPGFYATADAASMTASTGTACVTLTDNVLSDSTFSTLDGGNVVGSCEYTIGTLGAKTINILDGAKVILNFTSDTTIGAAKFNVAEGAELTIKGTGSTMSSAPTITSKGTLTINDAEIAKANVVIDDGTLAISGKSEINTLKATAGTITISDDATVDGAFTNGAESVTINGGTFKGKISAYGNIVASSGKYALSNTKDNINAIRSDKSTLTVYEDDSYRYIEPTLTADDITFNDITVAEDAEFDLADSKYAATATNGSATKFYYVITNAAGDEPFNNKAGEADDGTTSTKIADSGTYTITAISTFGEVEKEATLTVDSTLATFVLQAAKGNNSSAVKKYIAADTVYEENSDVVLYTGHTLDLSYVINDDDPAEVAFPQDTTAVVFTATTDNEEVINLDDVANPRRVAIKALKAGTAKVTITATSADGKTAKSIELSFTTYDLLKESNLATKVQLVNAGDTVAIKDLITLVNADGLNTEALAYSVTTNDTSFTVNDDDTVTFKKSRDTLGTPQITVQVEDEFAKSAARTIDAEIFVMDVADFAVTATTGTLQDYTATLDEDSDDELVISSALVDEVNNLKNAVDTYNARPGIADEDKLAPTFSYDIVTRDEEGNITVVDSSDYITLTDNEDGTATITPGLATEEDTPALVRVSTSDKVYRLIEVDVISHLTGASLYNTAEEAAIVTATLDEGLNNIVEKSADLTLTAGQTTNFQVAAISTSANLEVEATADSANVTLVKDSDTAFSIQANTAGEAVVTVIARGDHDEKITFTLNVTIEEAQEEPVNPETVVDGVYVIQSGLNYDKVVDVTSASVDDGANVQLYTANSTIAQKFIFRYDDNGYYTIENLKSGKVLTVNGSNVAQATNTGADAQLWQVIELDNGHVSIVSKSTGLYLDVYHGETADSTNIQVSTGNGTLSQQFSLGTVSQFADEPVLADGTYTIGSALKDGMMLDVAGNSTKNYANVWIYTANDTTAQDFELEYNGDGFYTIYTNREANLVLDVAGAGTTNRTNVHQYEANGTIAQQWMVVDNGDGTYSLASRCNGLYLDIQAGRTADRTNAWIYEANGTDAQKFIFTDVNAASEDDSEETE